MESRRRNSTERRDKKTYIKILNIKDEHKKEFFNKDGCGLEIEFGVVYSKKYKAAEIGGLSSF